jgi:hypothetical protein
MVLAPMVEEGKEAVGSMGDDTPLAVLSEKYRPLSHFFRQNFSQVTNPPIDPLRETGVMSLKTRFKNLGNILAQDAAQADVYVLESPVLTTGMYERIHGLLGEKNVVVIDCTMPLPAPEARPRRRPARQSRPHPGRGRGRGAARLRRHRPDRRGSARGPRGPADDPGHRRRPRPPGRQGPAVVRLDHRPLGRVPGHPLFRGAGRRRRHGGQRLPGPGKLPGSPGARPDRRQVAARRLHQLQDGHRGRPAEDHLQDGHQRHLLVPRRLQLRSRRPVARPGRRVLPRHAVAHLGHRPGRPGEQGGRAAPQGLGRAGRDPAGRRPLQAAPLGRGPRLRGAADPHPAERLRHRRLRALSPLVQRPAHPEADPAARPAGLALGPQPDLDRRRRERQRDPQALRHAGHEPGRPGPRGPRRAEHRHEPDRRQVGVGRGRRGQRALQAAAERRQPQQRHQAGGLGPVRRHRRISEPVPRDRDQGRPGRQARRGRPAARLQGHRDDRAPASRDARRDADQPAAAPRHLFDRGPGPAHL